MKINTKSCFLKATTGITAVLVAQTGALVSGLQVHHSALSFTSQRCTLQFLYCVYNGVVTYTLRPSMLHYRSTENDGGNLRSIHSLYQVIQQLER